MRLLIRLDGIYHVCVINFKSSILTFTPYTYLSQKTLNHVVFTKRDPPFNMFVVGTTKMEYRYGQNTFTQLTFYNGYIFDISKDQSATCYDLF